MQRMITHPNSSLTGSCNTRASIPNAIIIKRYVSMIHNWCYVAILMTVYIPAPWRVFGIPRLLIAITFIAIYHNSLPLIYDARAWVYFKVLIITSVDCALTSISIDSNVLILSLYHMQLHQNHICPIMMKLINDPGKSYFMLVLDVTVTNILYCLITDQLRINLNYRERY